jgi:hypothetical protein
MMSGLICWIGRIGKHLVMTIQYWEAGGKGLSHATSERTFVMTFNFFPWLYWDFDTAVSIRLISLSSNF